MFHAIFLLRSLFICVSVTDENSESESDSEEKLKGENTLYILTYSLQSTPSICVSPLVIDKHNSSMRANADRDHSFISFLCSSV